MRLRSLVLASAVWLPLAQGACGDPAPASFPTYQECFDDNAEAKMLPVEQSIVVCCINHPIANIKPACGATAPDCINYLTANLNQTSASTTEVMSACTEYIAQMLMPPED